MPVAFVCWVQARGSRYAVCVHGSFFWGGIRRPQVASIRISGLSYVAQVGRPPFASRAFVRAISAGISARVVSLPNMVILSCFVLNSSSDVCLAKLQATHVDHEQVHRVVCASATSCRVLFPQHVCRANEELAVDSLLVTDGLFRSRCVGGEAEIGKVWMAMLAFAWMNGARHRVGREVVLFAFALPLA